MIIRYGGGNHGIAEYLENGRKAEREYTRDELDHRFIIDGDLATTNKIIESIEDK
ncbi:relaxase, partial [Salmonella enterica]|nr:relaxase [Salmonella enterica subsp. enterica serovar Typhimurium]EFB8633306.1 relaxase [Escherichia coli]